jgi:hypothetical protein
VELDIHSYDMPARLLAHGRLGDIGLEGPRIKATGTAGACTAPSGLEITRCALRPIQALLLHSIRVLLKVTLHLLVRLLDGPLYLLSGLLNRVAPLLDGVRSLLRDVLPRLRKVLDLLPESLLLLRLRRLVLLGRLVREYEALNQPEEATKFQNNLVTNSAASTR